MTKRRTKLSYEEEEELIRSMEDFQKENHYFEKLKTTSLINVKIKCISAGQKELVNAIKTKELVFAVGMAGTGKTYLSCAVALELLKKNPDKYEKIILVKSVTVLPDEEIGFLKGTLKEKMEPIMYSFTGNFEKIIGKQLFNKLESEGFIEIKPIAYLRGVNIDNAIILIDETQNISKRNIRTILTRLGKNAKMVFLGDTEQVDLKRKNDSSLDFMFANFKEFDEIAFIELGEADEARNPLIPKLERKFNEIYQKEELEKTNQKRNVT